METAAMKQGRKVCSKLEAKIKELESELDQEQRRLTDTTKSLRKSERRIKELEFQVPYLQLLSGGLEASVFKVGTVCKYMQKKDLFPYTLVGVYIQLIVHHMHLRCGEES